MIAQKGARLSWFAFFALGYTAAFAIVLIRLLGAQARLHAERQEIATLRIETHMPVPVVRMLNPSVRDYADLYEHFRACGIAMAKIQNMATAERYGALHYHPYFPKAPK